MKDKFLNIYNRIFTGSLKNVFKISFLAAFVSGARFIYMFYFSTIDTTDQEGVANVVFINGNNALFISLFSTLVLIPLAQFKKYNLFGTLIYVLGAIMVSFFWNLLYGYSIYIVLLMILVMCCNLFYEFTRRILYIELEYKVKYLDITVSIVYLITLFFFILFKKSIYSFLLVTSLSVFCISLGLIRTVNREKFIQTDLKTFFKLNHSGVGQSLLMFLAGNYIFQLVSFFGSTQIFTKVNIIRVWITPISLLLNALDFVYSRDKYEGKVPNILLVFSIILGLLLVLIINNETAIYCSVFFVIIPFQFWLRGLQIKLRQNILHKEIWKINVNFTISSIILSTILVYFFHWKYWSWYLLLVYITIWITWNLGKKRELKL